MGAPLQKTLIINNKQKLLFLRELYAADAEAYAGDLWKSKVSPATYNQHIKFLRSIFGALETEAGLVTNPWAKITSTKGKARKGKAKAAVEQPVVAADLETSELRRQNS